MEALRQLLQPLIGQRCFRSLFEQFRITEDPQCTRLLISKALGLGIVAGGSLVKVPQLIKIVRAKSSEGLSSTAYLLETLAYAVSASYNYRHRNPFSTYGESVLVAVQNLMIIMLMFAYRSQPVRLVLAAALLVVSFYSLAYPTLVDDRQLAWLQVATIPVTLLSRIPQIMSNYQSKSTGQLSALTIFLYFFGSMARVFTTLQEVKDPLILWGFSLASILNGVLAGQMLAYWNAGSKLKRKRE